VQLAECLHRLGARKLNSWKEQIETSGWLDTKATHVSPRAGSELCECNEARLLWEEAAKLPATALTSGTFRHGPQEVIRPGMRFAVWIEKGKEPRPGFGHGSRPAEAWNEGPGDWAGLCRPNAGDLVLQIPSIPAEWQFVLDIVPIQMASSVWHV